RRASRHRRSDDVEVLVVALDPVERRDRFEVFAVVAGDVADTAPHRNVRVTPHDRVNGVELAVDVAERANHHRRRDWGFGGGDSTGTGRGGRIPNPESRITTACQPASAKPSPAREGPPCPRRSRPCCTPPARSPCP